MSFESYKNIFNLERKLPGNNPVFLVSYKEENVETKGKKYVLKRSNREGNFLKNISGKHEGVPTLKEILKIDGLQTIVLEYEENSMDLFDFITKNKTTEAQAKIIIRKLIETVIFLHNNDIIHCDIKPDNIVLSNVNNIESLKVILIDYDCAQFITGKKTYSGTSDYMSPESLDGIVTFAKDAWCIGIVTYNILTGRRPFVERTIRMGKCPHLPEYVSEECVDFVQKCLNKNHFMRITCEEMLEHPWLFQN